MKNSREFKFKDNHLLFICPFCGNRTIYPVLNVQRDTYKCKKCDKSTKGVFRHRPVVMKTIYGKEIQVTLKEISCHQAIFQVLNNNDVQYIKIGEEVRLICGGNPDFLPMTRCIVQSNEKGWVGIKKSIQ